MLLGVATGNSLLHMLSKKEWWETEDADYETTQHWVCLATLQHKFSSMLIKTNKQTNKETILTYALFHYAANFRLLLENFSNKFSCAWWQACSWNQTQILSPCKDIYYCCALVFFIFFHPFSHLKLEVHLSDVLKENHISVHLKVKDQP